VFDDVHIYLRLTEDKNPRINEGDRHTGKLLEQE
jgi:hypothetical protein